MMPLASTELLKAQSSVISTSSRKLSFQEPAESEKQKEMMDNLMANEYVEELIKSCMGADQYQPHNVKHAMKTSVSKGPSPTKQSIAVFENLQAVEDNGFSL